MQAMILAAGLGTRLRPFSLIRPKPLFPLFNKALLLLLIEQLQAAGFTRLIVNAHHLGEQIVALLSGMDFVTVLLEQEILGTGGGLRNALPFMSDEPLLVINGDIVHNLDLGLLYQRHSAADARLSMVVHHMPRFTSLSVDEQDRIIGIGKNRPLADRLRQFAFTGIHLIDPALLTSIPAGACHNIIDLYQRLIENGEPPHAMIVNDHYWRDMGTVKDYLGVHQDLIKGPELLAPYLEGIGSAGKISPTASLRSDSKIIDWAVVGDGVKAEEDVVLERSVVWDNVRLKKKSRFSDTVVVQEGNVAELRGA